MVVKEKKALISIILPCYNEAGNIERICNLISDIFAESNILFKYDLEMILIDDGSKDLTWDKIIDLSKRFNYIKGIRFSRNFGHQVAIEAGLEYANGSAVIMMDSDLQHPPEIIPRLIKAWEDGNQIVNTQRHYSINIPLFKRLTSSIYYKLINSIANVHIEEGSSDFRLLDRKIVDILNKMPEKSKFYRGLVNWVGFRKAIVKFDSKDRKSGKSSYSLRKMIELGRVGITSFSYLPLKIILIIGILQMIFATLFIAASSIIWFSGGPLYKTMLIVGFILASTGLIVILLGIIAIYQINMYEQLKGRPHYIVLEDTFSVNDSRLKD